MKLMNFFKGLLPNFERSRLTTEAAALKDSIRQNAKLSSSVAAVMQGEMAKRPKPKLMRSVDEIYARADNARGRRGAFVAMGRIFDVLVNHISAVETLIPTIFSKDIPRETLTYRKANVLQFLELVRFVDHYCVLYAASALRQVQIMATGLSEEESRKRIAPPATWRYLDDNAAAFVQALIALDNLPRDLVAAINDIPDLQINPDREREVISLVGATAIDPFRMGFVPVKINPFRAVGVRYAEWQAKRYHRRVAARMALELLIMGLRQSGAGGQLDPKTEAAIVYHEARLQRLNAEIAEMEEDYA